MYKFWGKVKKGLGRGRLLGFPTANIRLHKYIPEGVYFSKVRIKTRIFPSLTFVGRAKTFNEKLFQAESYIFLFKEALYNRWISIRLLKKIRQNKKFKNAQGLVAQMRKDEKLAREFFNV